jgi:hypothetical protein
MGRIKNGGVDTLVSLLEPAEAKYLGLADERAAAVEAEMEFLSFPISDRCVPLDLDPFRAFIERIALRVASGERVGVHCRGSIGRSTIATACTLIHLGWIPQAALTAIGRARGMPVPDTPEQENWILHYKARLLGQIDARFAAASSELFAQGPRPRSLGRFLRHN